MFFATDNDHLSCVEALVRMKADVNMRTECAGLLTSYDDGDDEDDDDDDRS